MIIRPLHIDDVDQVAAIEAECFEPPWDEAEFLRQIVTGGCLVAADGDRVRGFLAHQPAPAGRYIADLAVCPRNRRRGVGRKLLGHVIKLGQPLSLHVMVGNLAAHALYQASGFKDFRAEKGFYPGGLDALLMLRP